MSKRDASRLIVDGGDISSNLTQEFDLGAYETAAIQMDWTTSDCEGNIKFSIKPDNGTQWDNLQDGSDTDIEFSVAGSSASATFLITDCRAMGKARLVFTNTAGSTGTLDVYLTGVRMGA